MRQLSLTGVLTALAGLALLVWVVARSASRRSRRTFVRSAGGSSPIIAIGGLRFLVRALAWRLCLEPPYTLRIDDAFAAVVCGDAIGNVTPLGPLVGEPAKAAFVRGRIPLGARRPPRWRSRTCSTRSRPPR